MKRLLFSVLTIGTLLLGGFTSLQAQTNHDFARWEKEISAFEQSDRTNSPKGVVLFIGSSTIRLWKTLATDFPQQNVLNRGFGGSEIVDCTHFADRIVFPYSPKAIFLRSGGNDLFNGKSPEQVFADFKEFVAKVHEKLPQTDIYYISLSPSIARWKDADKTKQLNTMVEEFVKGKAHLNYIEPIQAPSTQRESLALSFLPRTSCITTLRVIKSSSNRCGLTFPGKRLGDCTHHE